MIQKSMTEGAWVYLISMWETKYTQQINKGCVTFDLAIYIKKYLKAKEELWKFTYSNICQHVASFPRIGWMVKSPPAFHTFSELPAIKESIEVDLILRSLGWALESRLCNLVSFSYYKVVSGVERVQLGFQLSLTYWLSSQLKSKIFSPILTGMRSTSLWGRIYRT